MAARKSQTVGVLVPTVLSNPSFRAVGDGQRSAKYPRFMSWSRVTQGSSMREKVWSGFRHPSLRTYGRPTRAESGSLSAPALDGTRRGLGSGPFRHNVSRRQGCALRHRRQCGLSRPRHLGQIGMMRVPPTPRSRDSASRRGEKHYPPARANRRQRGPEGEPTAPGAKDSGPRCRLRSTTERVPRCRFVDRIARQSLFCVRRTTHRYLSQSKIWKVAL